MVKTGASQWRLNTTLETWLRRHTPPYYEEGGGDLDAIRENIDDAASARVWDMFLTHYRSFLRTGDDAAVDALAAGVAASSV